LCVGAGGIAGGYLWNRAPEGPPNQAEAKPKPKDGAKPPEVEVPPGSDKPLAELPADPPPKLAAFVPASPPAKSAVPRPAVVFVGNPDVADTVVYRLDSPVLRTEDIYFTNGPSRKFGFFAPIGKGKQLAHRFYLFDADTRQMPSSELPFGSFSPCRRTLSPSGKYIASDVRVPGAGLSLRISIWQVGMDEPVVKEWGLPGGAPKVLLRNFFFTADDQLVTVTAAGLFEWWQVPEMRSLKQYQIPGSGLNSVVAISTDRTRSAVFEKNHFKIIDLAKGRLIAETLPLTPIPGQQSVFLLTNATAFSADSSKLACVIQHLAAEPVLCWYDTATGKAIGVPAKLHQGNMAQYCTGWFGAEHCFVYDRFLGKPVGIYRVGDTGHCAVLSGPPAKVHVAMHAPDDRLWYVPAIDPADPGPRLVGTRMPPSIALATPERPVEMVLGTNGLRRN
jgi:hypothetical protein